MIKNKGWRTFLCFLTVLSLLSFTLAGCVDQQSDKTDDEEKVIRIGYQKNGPLIILKSLGSLEKALEEHGFTVEWKEFQAGPAMMEALNAGSIDFGRTGNSPPIFAQAAGTSLLYVAAGKSKYKGSGILVPSNSAIRSLEDLKGKKIGFAKGSSSHFLLVKALEKAGLTFNDIEPAYLSPGDARVAFEQGNIDAWVVWDPYASSTEVNSGAIMIVDGEGLTTDRDFFVATPEFGERYPEILDVVISEIQKSSDWANENHDELVKMLSPILKLDEPSIKRAVERRIYGVDELTPEIMEEQQQIADTFHKLGIIPTEIVVDKTP